MKKFYSLLLCIIFLLFTSVSAQATVLDFDSLSSSTDLNGTGYGGLTWGTSTDDAVPGNTSSWRTNTSPYATPSSLPNYVFNAYGGNNLWFSFSSATFFNGAYFMTAGATPAHQAEEVRFRDNLGNLSAWLTLTVSPQFLAASFANSTTLYVERQGGAGGSSSLGNGRWFAMDDVTYGESAQIPEPATMLLLGTGLTGIAALRRKFKK